ncbi:hypothetical protein H0B56_01675 [Haloechinothrix sp. YIM 98757]|uniref:Uncharacterized protein n=1 Tax=Haloechinothrix aidingensis TaxID=2752311 RepID=A0A838A629_9PSEU|nr:hypothetical protein [Haloechinothrix aidingensis]MBA0124245.1 hypothetical protein [Haloechinothrix aidingensis]
MMPESPEHKKRHVVNYVEMESSENVTRAEMINTVGVFGQQYDVWDVRTDNCRWWAITNLLNLYNQDRFPSMDETLSFHIGMMMRLSEHNRRTADSDDEEDLLPSAWRRFGQAVEAHSLAVEPEDYQTVAIRSREALLAMVRDLSDKPWMLDETPPKAGDFKGWISLICRSLTEGRLRSYLTAMADKTWDLAVSLQHNTSADQVSTELLLDGVRHAMQSIALIVIGHDRGTRSTCPKCGSVRIESDYRPESGLDYPHFVICGACGWETQATPLCPAAATKEQRFFEEHGDALVTQERNLDEVRRTTNQQLDPPEGDEGRPR